MIIIIEKKKKTFEEWIVKATVLSICREAL